MQYPSLPLLALDSFVVLSYYSLTLKISKDECLQSQAINANKSIQRPWALAVFDCSLALPKDDYTCQEASPLKPQCPQDPRPRSLPLSAVILLTQQTRPYGVSLAAPSAEDSWVTRIAVDRGSGCAQGTSPFKRKIYSLCLRSLQWHLVKCRAVLLLAVCFGLSPHTLFQWFTNVGHEYTQVGTANNGTMCQFTK